MNPPDPASPSVHNREFIVRVFSRYGAIFLLFMHIPFAFAVGPAYLFNTVLPSVGMTCLHFLMPWILPRYGTTAGAVWILSISMAQTFALALWTGEAAGIQYYFFSISAVAIYLFHGHDRGWMLTFTLLPVALFAAIELAVPNDGLVIHIDRTVTPWLAAVNGFGSFAIFIVMGMIFSRVTTEAQRLLAQEKARSEALLLNILPQPIAERLKSGAEKVIADRIDEVSVLFADLVGFTPYAREREPVAVVGMLNTLFSRFDARVDALGLEKIKTVGDAYMVVAGAPDRRPDHLEALARLALGLIDEVRAFSDREGQRFAVRIGLHTGPVVTGVIGTRKMAYDVWGDTVNVASRLETASLPDRIHVSPEVMRRLDDRFRFEARGATEIKGIGPMQTWFLTASV